MSNNLDAATYLLATEKVARKPAATAATSKKVMKKKVMKKKVEKKAAPTLSGRWVEVRTPRPTVSKLPPTVEKTAPKRRSLRVRKSALRKALAPFYDYSYRGTRGWTYFCKDRTKKPSLFLGGIDYLFGRMFPKHEIVFRVGLKSNRIEVYPGVDMAKVHEALYKLSEELGESFLKNITFHRNRSIRRTRAA